MSFTISSQNIIDYLAAQKLCSGEEKNLFKIEPKPAKNFNLLLTLPEDRQLLAKQERHNQEGKTAGEFFSEWRLHEFLQHFPQLCHMRSSVSEVLHFDAEHSIIVFNYLSNYRDLADFYARENVFPTAIATEIGAILAQVHRSTLDNQEYQDYFSQHSAHVTTSYTPNFGLGLERIGTEVFGLVPAEGLKFFALYQRYDSLGKAIAELATAFESCCLTHNDLKLNNILLHNNWESDTSNESRVRLIDWERSAWGDPAFDLGALIASYMHIWLNSLVISKSIDVEEALRLAMTPLELLQPSMKALTEAYLSNFPEILQRRPDFLKRVVQFSGFAMIQQIQAMIQHQKSFGNVGICTLQVAKSLLCRPEQSMSTVFSQLIRNA
ncbi:MAG: aminoglycoside phosphotransferase family protein [Desmonostoc vinosum HA7617-LM4]|jgi:hypothetical protein|nr:aminoglycoside phosphotransferase family protein [Desmonostoc vinosum HA7617-LM4]